MKSCLSFVLMAFLMAICCQNVYAQEKKWVSGTLKDTSGTPIVFASILEKGTTNQTASDAKGEFRIQVAPGAILQIRSMGFATREVETGSGASLNLVLEYASTGLDEVVVTALGISRQKKSLGYAMQEVKGNTLVDAREPNLTNALTGVVAGLQIIRSSTGPAGSSKINLRGNNSLTGSNQPLIVVDGIPVDNFIGTSDANNGFWDPSLDMGNGLADLNANDIENISVLKGPAAAALYGSRAGNGVIMITTKTGKKTKGLGITVSHTIGFESIFTNPKTQMSFAQGNNATFEPTAATSWGPKITGQTVTNWDGQSEQLKAYDNVDNFYRTGVNNNTNLSFQQQFNKTSIYTSLNHLRDKSLIPGTELTRTNLMARTVSNFGTDDRWTTDFKVQYSNAEALNRPAAGVNNRNYSSLLYNMPVSMDVTQFKDPVDQYNNMRWFGIGNQVNPYWATQYHLNQDVRDRFIMNGTIKYRFASWLDAEIKGGADKYTTSLENKTYAGSPLAANGSYLTGKYTFTELNYSTLITAKKDNLFGRLGGAVSVGGNLMQQKSSRLVNNAINLVVPNLFSVRNVSGSLSLTDEMTEQRINSVYGTIGLNWDGFLFLDATMRNDWASTLSKDNRSYFYPSLSLSYVFTESFDGLPSWLSFGKVRGSFAAVGNSLPPYQILNYYNITPDPNQQPVASRHNTLFDPNVKSELIKSIEVGTELRFVNNRFGVDFAFYKNNATRQLIDLPMDPGSGYEFRKINAGDIENKGFEIAVDARVIESRGGFNWNLAANFSRNRNMINDILSSEGVNRYQLGGFDAVSILAATGALYGEIYGSKFLRVTDDKSEHYGKLLLSSSGLPQMGEQNARLGNQQAKALIGITNTFGYKDFTLSFLVDGRFGGDMFSTTHTLMQRNGTADITAPGGERPDMVVDGVIDAGGGNYVQNTQTITTQQYWNAAAGLNNLGITELNIYDASNIRLRNVQLNYNFPQRLLAKTAIKSARIGLSCNNVWLISSHMRGLDPESVMAIGTNATGFENGAPPTTRTFLANVSLSF